MEASEREAKQRVAEYDDEEGYILRKNFVVMILKLN